jgi:ADP-heptose:LPS heptosyltransferase
MPDRILALLFGDLGDTLLTVPAMRAVRRQFPASKLVVMAKAAPALYVRELGLADEVIDIDKHALDRLRSLANPVTAARLLRLIIRLRRAHYGQLLIFQHLTTRWGALKYALLSLATGAPVRAGLDNGRGWFLTHRVADRGFGATHESQYWLQVAAQLGARGEVLLEAPVSDADRCDAAALLSGAGISGHRILALHPGVGWYGPGRQWGPTRFAEAAALILQRVPMKCIVVGTEADQEAADLVAVRLGPKAWNLVGRTTTGQLAAVLERSALLLSNDSGVAHLAAAVHTRTLTVFGPSNDLAWRPLGGDVISSDVPCRPCFYRDFEIGLRNGCATRECLTQITPATVAERALQILEVATLGV